MSADSSLVISFLLSRKAHNSATNVPLSADDESKLGLSSSEPTSFSRDGNKRTRKLIKKPIQVNPFIFLKVILCLLGFYCSYLAVSSTLHDSSLDNEIFSTFRKPATTQRGVSEGGYGSSFTQTTQGQTKDQTKIDNIPVFYNLFVLDEADHNETMRVRDLVNEQMSYLIPDIHYPVYVHSIGKELPIPNTELLGHHPVGEESVTLHSLWQYCQKHKEKKVVYLHSKGSFHNTEENDLLRRFITRSVLSRKCAYKDKHENSQNGTTISSFSCNVCSSRFSPFPHPHTSGNMFLADCDYVSKLINPLDFEDRMNDIPRVKENLLRPLQDRVHPSMIGIERFSNEHWILSAPFVKPCDLYKDSEFTYGYEGLPNATVVDTIDLEGEDSAFELQPAPRFPFRTYQGPHLGSAEQDYWTGLQYRLQEYQALYNETPPWPSLGSSPSSSTWWGWRMNEFVDDLFTSPAMKVKQG